MPPASTTLTFVGIKFIYCRIYKSYIQEAIRNNYLRLFWGLTQ
jgi:hypothetical protein